MKIHAFFIRTRKIRLEAEIVLIFPLFLNNRYIVCLLLHWPNFEPHVLIKLFLQKKEACNQNTRAQLMTTTNERTKI